MIIAADTNDYCRTKIVKDNREEADTSLSFTEFSLAMASLLNDYTRAVVNNPFIPSNALDYKNRLMRLINAFADKMLAGIDRVNECLPDEMITSEDIKRAYNKWLAECGITDEENFINGFKDKELTLECIRENRIFKILLKDSENGVILSVGEIPYYGDNGNLVPPEERICQLVYFQTALEILFERMYGKEFVPEGFKKGYLYKEYIRLFREIQ